MKKALKQAHKDVLQATRNPNIFNVIDENWSTLKYEDGISLARFLHEEEGGHTYARKSNLYKIDLFSALFL